MRVGGYQIGRFQPSKADGSQIFADRHAEQEYGLVNTGAIWMRSEAAEAPAAQGGSAFTGLGCDHASARPFETL